MSNLLLLQRVDWNAMPADTPMSLDLSRIQAGGEVFLPEAQAFAAVQRVNGQVSKDQAGNVIDFRPEVIGERHFPYFADGYVDCDRPRSSGHQDQIRQHTIGYALAT